MVTTNEVYDYVKHGDVDKVKEYLLALPDIVNKSNTNIIQSLFFYALDWKQTDIVILLVDHWRADPTWQERFTIYYTSWNTNKLPVLSLSEYIYYGRKPEEKTC